MHRASYRDANHYRARADECRAIAEQFLHGDARNKMFKVAAEYEVMADSVDELGKLIDELDEFTPAHARSRKFG